MNDPITAKVVSTHEPERPKFDEAWIVDVYGAGGERDRVPNLYEKLAEAQEQAAHYRDEGFLSIRILRLPSEAESALAPLVAARDRAAVELARYSVTPKCDNATLNGLKYVFILSDQALDAALAAQKGTG